MPPPVGPVEGTLLARTTAPRPVAPPAPTTAIRPPPPIVGEVDRLLAQGKIEEAVLRGYLTAEADVLHAFGIQAPRQWTHREFLRGHLRSDMGYVAVLLPRLYALYEPVRYGSSRTVPPQLVHDLVHAIYDEGPIFNLYRDPNYVTRLSRPGDAARAGGSSSASSRPTASVIPP